MGYVVAHCNDETTEKPDCGDIGDTVSGCKDSNFGVPQGSVLGPKIYCMYTKPITDIIAEYDLPHHSYADDTQLYLVIEHCQYTW